MIADNVEAVFGARSGARHQSVSHTQAPHSWVVIKGLGAIDISIKRRFVTSGDRFEMPIDWVFLGSGPPLRRCSALFRNNRQDYQVAIDDFHQQNRAAGTVHLADSFEQLDDARLNHGAARMQSPLAYGLRERLGKDPFPLYLALLSYMNDFISERAAIRAGLTFDGAWDCLHTSANRNAGLTPTSAV